LSGAFFKNEIKMIYLFIKLIYLKKGKPKKVIKVLSIAPPTNGFSFEVFN